MTIGAYGECKIVIYCNGVNYFCIETSIQSLVCIPRHIQFIIVSSAGLEFQQFQPQEAYTILVLWKYFRCAFDGIAKSREAADRLEWISF